MKKIIFTLLTIALLITASPVSADNNTYLTPINPKTSLVYMEAGQLLMTSFGMIDKCPIWYFGGCQIEKSLFAYFIN